MFACMLQTWADEAISFIERSWDTTTELVKNSSVQKQSGQYELISGNSNDWQQLGPSQQYYVVKGNVGRKTLLIKGTVHLILCDGAQLTLTGGVKLWWQCRCQQARSYLH